MGRKPLEKDYDATVMDGALVLHKEEELTIQKADELYLAGQEYDELRLIKETQSLLKLAKDSVVGAGEKLILLKAHGGHGNFGFICQKVGIEQRTANRYMKLARIFGKFDKLSNLPASKLNALELLSSDQLEKIDNGDEISGITLEGIAAMTESEVREEVKRIQAEMTAQQEDHQKKVEALEKVVRQKEGKISDMEMELAGRQPPTKEDIAQAKLDEKRKPLFTAIMSGIEDLSVAIDRVEDICRTDDVQLDQLTRLARSFDCEMSLLKEKLDTLDEALNAACPIKEDVPCTSNTPNE